MPRSATCALVHLAASGAPDAHLLRAFTASQADDAFAEIVRRHGPMVRAACRRVLSDAHDADDAFQAVFIVLARKAGSIRGTNLPGWLYGVAVRTARGVRLVRDRRRRHERAASVGRARPADGAEPAPDPDLAALIDEELARLPEHYRAALVACELRGLSRRRAAGELGVPEGTLSSRLAAAKRKLAERLAARGVAGTVVFGTVLAPSAVPAALLEATALAVRGAAGGAANAAAAAVVKGMLFDQLKAVVVSAAVCLTAVGAGLALTGSPDAPTGRAVAPAPRAVEDPAAKLVEQLGGADFAEREAAERDLRKLGFRAEAALRTGLKSDSAEARDRCAKLLTDIRKGALDDLVRTFDPAGDKEPDHPIWKRFKAVAGNTPASRTLFGQFAARSRLAAIQAGDNWLARLDTAETGPEAAARQYREVASEFARRTRANLHLSFHIPVWPLDHADEAAFLLFLGTYPGTSGGPSHSEKGSDLFYEGEDRLHYARGLQLGLSGQMLDPAKWDFTPSKAPAGTDRAFARLFAAWLERRDPTAANVPSCLWLAAKHGTKEILPLARTIAADKFPHDRLPGPRLYAAALAVVARCGTPADRPLFERHFKNDRAAETFEFGSPAGAAGKPAKGTAQLRDCAYGLALLLHGEDPAAHGFLLASGKKAKAGERPSMALYEARDFAFLDGGDESRTAAHTKAAAFLDKQKDEPKPDPGAAKLVEQLGGADFAGREAAERDLRKLGFRAEAALKTGLKSDSAETRDRCAKLLDHLRTDLLGGKESPVWQRFKAVAGAGDDAWKLYLRTVGNRRRAEMLLAAVEDPARAAASYAKECDELSKVLGLGGSSGVGPAPKPPGFPDREVTPDDLTALLFLGTLPHGARKDPPGESGAVINHVLVSALTGEHKKPFGALWAAWTGPRPAMHTAGVNVALSEGAPGMAPVARAVLAVEKLEPADRARALQYLGLHGAAADAPLALKFAGDATECARFDFSKIPGGALGPWRPALKNTDVVVQVRDVAVIAALRLHKERPGAFGFESDVVQDGGPPPAPHRLAHLGFCTDAARAAAHAKARAFLDKQKVKEPEPPPEKGAKVWPHFAKVVGDDKDGRALFDLIVADPKNLELLETAATGGNDLAKLYFARRDDLYRACHRDVPGMPGRVKYAPVPLADAAGWLLLGTYPGTKAAATSDVTLVFLRPEAARRAAPFADALAAGGPAAAPLCKLTGAWLANRGDDLTAYEDGLPLALQYDIPAALPVARRLLKDYAESNGGGAQPFTKSRIRALSLLLIAKYGSAADLPLITPFLTDKNLAASSGKSEHTAQVRDAAAVAAVALSKGDARTFGFCESARRDGVTVTDGLDLAQIGFASPWGREAAHKKAQALLDKQK